MRQNLFRSSALVVGVMLVTITAGCAWQPQLEQRQDPLIGQIIDADSRTALSFDQLIERARQADVVYLGERHDNAEHHQIQLTIIQALIDAGQRPAVGFEFFDTGQSGYLMQYVAGKASLMKLGHGAGLSLTAGERLRKQLGWSERADTDWNYYFQLIELARKHQLPVFGADLPASIRLRLSRGDIDSLTAVEQQPLALMPLPDDDYKRFMYEHFKAGHCGWGSEPLLARLYRTWAERNRRMAASIVAMVSSESQAESGQRASDSTPKRGGGTATARNSSVVMILGGGHSEHNRAVVAQVSLLRPDLRQLNIGLQEISVDVSPLDHYVNGSSDVEHDFGPRFDLLWFTQRQDYRDRCAELTKPQ